MSLWPFHHRRKAQNIAAVPQTIQGLHLSSSARGLAIPILYGQARVAANLIHYKKLPPLGAGNMYGLPAGSDVPDYGALAMVLCEGPIVDVVGAWADKKKFTSADITALGFTKFLGTLSQAAWSYLTTNFPGEAVPYELTAYLANARWPLPGGSPGNIAWEVQGLLAWGSGILDANPKDVITDFLTDPNHGCLFPSSLLGNLTAFRDYCTAAGIFISPVVETQRPAIQHLQEFLAAASSAFVWSDGLLKIVPYGDQQITGNGVTFTPNTTPLYNLTDDDFITAPGDDPVHVVRRPQSDVYNMVQVEFDNRAIDYNGDIAEGKDQASIETYTLKPAPVIKAPFIKTAAVARLVAQLAVQRQVYIRNIFAFKLPFRYVLLEPMDLVTLTDANLGLVQTTVRLTEVAEEDDGSFLCMAEEWPFGVATAAAYGTPSGVPFIPDSRKIPSAPVPSVSFDSTGQAILSLVGDLSTQKHIYVLRIDRLPTLAETRAGTTSNFQIPSSIATGVVVAAGAAVYVGDLAYNGYADESPLVAMAFRREGSGTSAAPVAFITPLNTEVDDTIWNLQFSAVAGSGGGGANLTYTVTTKGGGGIVITLSSGNATLFPLNLSVVRHPRVTKMLRFTVTDTSTGLVDTATWVIPSQRSEIDDTARFKRANPHDDGDYSTRGTSPTGDTVHGGVKHFGGVRVQRLLAKALDADADNADGVPEGLTYGHLAIIGRTQAFRRVGTHGQNLVYNFGYEDGISFWSTVTGVSVVTDSLKAQTGNKYLQISGLAGSSRSSTPIDDAGALKDFEVNEGDVVQFGGWIYREGGDQTCSFFTRATDKDHLNTSFPATGSVAVAAWTFVSGEYVVPAGKKYLQGPVAEVTGGTINSIARFDNVFVKILRPTNDVLAGALRTGVNESGGKAVNLLLGKALSSDPDTLNGVVDGLTYKKVTGVVSSLITSSSSTGRNRCKVYNVTANQSIANGTPAALTFNTEKYDVGSLHDTATNTTRITVPTGGNTGVWELIGQVTFSGASVAGYRGAFIYKNGVLLARVTAAAAPVGVTTIQVVAFDDAPAATDYYELWADQTGVANLLIVDSPTETFFSATHLW